MLLVCTLKIGRSSKTLCRTSTRTSKIVQIVSKIDSIDISIKKFSFCGIKKAKAVNQVPMSRDPLFKKFSGAIWPNMIETEVAYNLLMMISTNHKL